MNNLTDSFVWKKYWTNYSKYEQAVKKNIMKTVIYLVFDFFMLRVFCCFLGKKPLSAKEVLNNV
jgi:hypothetical protein